MDIVCHNGTIFEPTRIMPPRHIDVNYAKVALIYPISPRDPDRSLEPVTHNTVKYRVTCGFRDLTCRQNVKKPQLS